MNIEKKDPDLVNITIQNKKLQKDLSSILSDNSIIIDIGANRGQFLSEIIDIKKNLEIHCFEPVSAAYNELKTLYPNRENIYFHKKAVTLKSGTVNFTVTECDVGSSVLVPYKNQSSKWLTVDHVEQVEATRLDDFLSTGTMINKTIDLLKIDAQGHDLNVIESAGSFLDPNHVKALLIEVSFRNFYENQCSFHDILRYADTNNYRLAWLYQHLAYDGFLWWADALFLPK